MNARIHITTNPSPPAYTTHTLALSLSLQLSPRERLQDEGEVAVVVGGAGVLDGPGNAVVVREDPTVAVPPEGLEGRVLQVHELLLDDRLVLALAALDVHETRHRGAAHRPLSWQGHQILHRGDVPGLSRLDLFKKKLLLLLLMFAECMYVCRYVYMYVYSIHHF